ncbi:thrombospondin type-1 domain-containing protein 4 isoform X1 [Xenopus laevis]|uniref:Thrombospondin type-1 domain-containing protein 4 isoform X1 n=1 Tax=Xenopus laevis TaxID=8355 RepID=A0A8J1MLN9_XENLA|nr:thrombospondin type-1 domain-containing protein 4 isoform X1 [Xenopus laevis]XP_041442689.1 thrombospondin type-1 domain-containing protein 4 isoform X1 [Xenopus laevis]
MVDCSIVSLRLVSAIVLLGVQLVVSQQSIDHRKVPQRIEQQSDTAGNITTVPSGTWGTWGPWSACSRSCNGGVMEQTRPCLPAHYQERSYQAPSQQYSAGERAHSNQNNLNHDTVISPYSGHVVSAIRTSVPLHRRGDNPRFNIPSSGHLSQNHHNRGILRGGRQSLPGQISRHEKRNRTQGVINPGFYGYGKVPYALPLQSDTGQEARRTRRQRPSVRQSAYKQNTDALINQRQATHSQVSSIPQGLYPDISRHGFASLQLLQEQPQVPRGATAITCIGQYKQYKICNKNLCPGSNRGIREVQCASYNNKPFMGRLYEWEPFTEEKGALKCELTCRAVGYRFYVRQAEKVIDGAPCDHNGTAICVSGQCKNIGCDDYLGSDKVLDKCGVCGGDNTACKVVSGVFKHVLTKVGYHKVVEIPEGATKINVTEMTKSNNYLALRSRSGRSIINGNWAIDRPGRYEGGGTLFTYKRPNEISSTAGESFLAEGPTNEALDVYMIHQQPNPGIHYEYVIAAANAISPQLPPHRRPAEPFNGQLEEETSNPTENRDSFSEIDTGSFPGRHPGRYPSHQPDNQVLPLQPPRRSRDFNWKQVGSTECSTTCGKGSRYPVFRCVNRNTHEETADVFCDSSTKPSPEEEPCNLFPCPAFWDIGEWSECSKTCGLGMQHRQILCRHIYANRTLTVQPHRCQSLEKPETTSTCQLKICSEWQIRTDWTPCSVPCGVGQKTRDVKCISNIGDVVDDEECNMKLRPDDIENCDMGPCAKSWFLTEWSDRCSAECGEGVRTRSVVCMSNHISSLPLEGCGNHRPPETTACNNGPCEGKVEWFTGSWSQCSVECGTGTQQRDVICITKTAEGFNVVKPNECSYLERPPNQQSCHLKSCGAKWFNTDWSACSKSCEGGFRIREVRCLADDMAHSDKCDQELKPEDTESCNTQDCMPEIDENCKDKYYNCNVVVQARLCVYAYYKTACCASCLRAASRQSGFLGRR